MPTIYAMTGFILFVPAVLVHVLIAVSNTVMPATAPVLNAGREYRDVIRLVPDLPQKINKPYSVFIGRYSIRVIGLH